MVIASNGRLGMVCKNHNDGTHIGILFMWGYECVYGEYPVAIIPDENLPPVVYAWTMEKRREWTDYWKVMEMTPVKWLDWRINALQTM